MPFVRVKHRHHRRHRISAAFLLRGIKISAVIMLFSLVIGRVAIEVVNAFSTDPRRPVITAKNPLAMTGKLIKTYQETGTVPQEMKDQIIQSYKDNYGDNWKTKLKEDYASRKTN